MHQSKWDQERFSQDRPSSPLRLRFFNTPLRYIIGLCLGAVILFSLWCLTEPEKDSHLSGTLPILKPLEGPAKIRPKDNLKDTHQDKTIYEKLSDKEEPRKIEHLLGGPEEPIAQPLNLPEEFIGKFIEDQSVTSQASSETAKEQQTISVSQGSDKQKNTLPSVREEEVEEHKKSNVVISGPKVKAPSPSSDVYCLQLGTLKTEEDARLEWDRLNSRQVLKPFLSQLTPDYRKIDLGNELGTRVRLIVGSMTEKEAKVLCSKLIKVSQKHNITLGCKIKKR